MRARNIKPGLFDNEILGSADPLFTILFEGLWCMADREGRLEDRPLRINGSVFRYRRSITERKTDTMLAWLRDQGFIARYEVAGKKYIQVLEFLKHQHPHKNEAPSQIPALSALDDGPRPDPEPGQGKTDARPRPVALGLIPDSGFSDSGFRIPDSAENRPRADARTAQVEDSSQFERTLQQAYPKTPHREDWFTALKHCRRLVEEGLATWQDFIGGARRYAAFVDGGGISDPRYINTPVTFFTSNDKPWARPWTVPTGPESAFEEIMRLNGRAPSTHDDSVIDHEPAGLTRLPR